MPAHAARSAPHAASAPSRSHAAVDADAIRVSDDHRWLRGDYDGHGKSAVQEACDSARALGIALIASVALSAAAAVSVIAWL